jgi:hypothetical protein
MNERENESQTQEAPVEIMSVSAVESLERAQIDMQVSTAKKYPRSIKKFLLDAKSMISEDLETAESCNYKLKRKGKDGEKFIEGPSIRLLEIAASAYTNIRYGSRIIGIDEDFVTAQGVSHDMERNVASSVEVKRSIKGKYGRYSQDMIGVTSNAAGSIARRNALNGVVPRSYVNQLSDFAKKMALGDIKTLPERRQRAFEFFTNTLRVPLERVLTYLEKPSVEDCNLDDLDKLTGLKTALKEGETTLEAEFPPLPKTPAQTGPPEDTKKPDAEAAKTGAAVIDAAKTGEAKETKAPEQVIDKPLEHLLGLCKRDSVTEAQVHKFMVEKKLAGRSTEQLAQAMDSNMLKVIETWPAVIGEIRAIKV